jgi:hypothetical protein
VQALDAARRYLSPVSESNVMAWVFEKVYGRITGAFFMRVI